jgi:Cu-processing system permease protein
MFLMVFEDYPLDKFSLIATLLNPVDLSRVLILLKLDISALLGYTGAVFQQFFGTSLGFFTSLIMLGIWFIVPTFIMQRIAKKKDF